MCITGATVGVGLCNGNLRSVNFQRVALLFFSWVMVSLQNILVVAAIDLGHSIQSLGIFLSLEYMLTYIAQTIPIAGLIGGLTMAIALGTPSKDW